MPHAEVSYRFSMLFAYCTLYLVGYAVGFQDLKLAYGLAFLLSTIGSISVCYLYTKPPATSRGWLLLLACLILGWGAFQWSAKGTSPELVPIIPALTTVATLTLIWLGGPGRMPFVLLFALMAIGLGLVVLHRLTWPAPPGSALFELGTVGGLTFVCGLAASLISRGITPTVAA